MKKLKIFKNKWNTNYTYLPIRSIAGCISWLLPADSLCFQFQLLYLNAEKLICFTSKLLNFIYWYVSEKNPYLGDNTGCPTTYQTRQFFNNSKTNEDIATRFEKEYARCVRNEKECVCSKIMSVCVCSKIIKELPGLVGSGTPYITYQSKTLQFYYIKCYFRATFWDPRIHFKLCWPWICTLQGLKMTQKESKHVALK